MILESRGDNISTLMECCCVTMDTSDGRAKGEQAGRGPERHPESTRCPAKIYPSKRVARPPTRFEEVKREPKPALKSPIGRIVDRERRVPPPVLASKLRCFEREGKIEIRDPIDGLRIERA